MYSLRVLQCARYVPIQSMESNTCTLTLTLPWCMCSSPNMDAMSDDLPLPTWPTTPTSLPSPTAIVILQCAQKYVSQTQYHLTYHSHKLTLLHCHRYPTMCTTICITDSISPDLPLPPAYSPPLPSLSYNVYNNM